MSETKPVEFNSEDVQKAKSFVREYSELSAKGNSDEADKLAFSNKDKSFIKALPSQFYFNFPEDTYENQEENLKNGVDQKVKFYPDEFINGFCICFTDKSFSDSDLMVSSLLNCVLPEWLIWSDECNLELSEDSPDFTVKELYQYLVDMGFEYKATFEDGAMDCLFKDLLE